MEIGGFVFTVEELDGCRLIEVSFPPTIDMGKLSQVIAAYYDLWDAEVPTLSLVDLSRVPHMTESTQQVLRSVIQRTVLQPSFVAAAWYTGANSQIYDEIVRVREDAGRETNDVYATREDAIAFLREAIAVYRDRPGPTVSQA